MRWASIHIWLCILLQAVTTASSLDSLCQCVANKKKFPCQVAEPTGAAEEGRLEMEDLMPRSLKFDECWIGETPATQESLATQETPPKLVKPNFGGVVDESPSPTNADPSPSPTNASIAGLADEAGLINISPWR